MRSKEKNIYFFCSIIFGVRNIWSFFFAPTHLALKLVVPKFFGGVVAGGVILTKN